MQLSESHLLAHDWLFHLRIGLRVSVINYRGFLLINGVHIESIVVENSMNETRIIIIVLKLKCKDSSFNMF